MNPFRVITVAHKSTGNEVAKIKLEIGASVTDESIIAHVAAKLDYDDFELHITRREEVLK